MGQWEIRDFLEKSPKQWFTARQLSDELGVSFGSVGNCVKRLRKAGLINFKMMLDSSCQGRKTTREVFAYRFKKG